MGPALTANQAAAAVLAQDSLTAPGDPADTTAGGSVPLSTPVTPATTGTGTTTTTTTTTTSTTNAVVLNTGIDSSWSQSSSSSTDGIGLSKAQHQQVVSSSHPWIPEAAVNSVVSDISKAYEPQLTQQAELIRTTKAAQLVSVAAQQQTEQDRARAETNLQSLQQQNAASDLDLARRKVHLPSRSIDEAKNNERLRGHARNPARLVEFFF